ncbi:MAG: hypothetical protein EOO38_14365 [Cytophagaceae bacterium]|nr:MAG: hypothetical protein EOO38_14365 [Cytophagaceae bacterium]
MLGRLQEFISSRPSDLFALLLEALMIDCFEDDSLQSIACLENIYLKNETYTPAISYMACALREFGYEESARDYLDEALRKDPHNVQALLLDGYLRGSIWGKRCIPDPVKHITDAPYPTSSYSILFSAYAVQDPRFEEGAIWSGPQKQDMSGSWFSLA